LDLVDRIDQRYGTDGKYNYDPKGGLGVRIYILDSGVDAQHREFNGRAENYNA
jgi:subtilisin family serine protease